MGDQLIDFLRSKREQAPGPGPDWQLKKDRWVQSVENLYRFIEEMLGDAIASEDVTVEKFNLHVTVGGERVEFRPKGVTVIGASGRVDVRGDRDTVTLLKDAPDIESGWTVVLHRVPHRTTVPLDRESLKDVLERVMLPLP
jgi:hypothetical protein